MGLAGDLAALDDRELSERFKSGPRLTATKIRPLLKALAQNDEPQTPERLADSLGWSVKEVREKLTLLVSSEPRLFASTAEFLPGSETMVSMLETKLAGPITAANLSDANRICIEIVNSIVRPRYKSFIRRELSEVIDDTDQLRMGLDELVNFLLEDYRAFVKQQEQGLTSKAGGLNEAILVQALKNGGLVETKNFEITGTKSKGDLAIYCDNVTPRETLFVEVKSFGARERLLRGLQDVQPPKVGIGFFNQANEFNQHRTQQFLDTQALAIYMPEATYSTLNAIARSRTNNRNTPFYRPFDQFVSDMRAFTDNALAAYS